jgi:CBS domain-containing protein
VFASDLRKTGLPSNLVEAKLIDRETAETLTVGEVMLPNPKTVDVAITVGAARERFQNQTLRSLLLAEGDRFRGVLERHDLPDSAADEAPAVTFARMDVVSVKPTQPMHEVLPAFEQLRERRIVVLDENGETLRGLLCLKRDGRAFCIEGPGGTGHSPAH